MKSFEDFIWLILNPIEKQIQNKMMGRANEKAPILLTKESCFDVK